MVLLDKVMTMLTCMCRCYLWVTIAKRAQNFLLINYGLEFAHPLPFPRTNRK